MPSRNSSCFKSMTPMQYVSATLCAHQSMRLWADVLGHLTLCPFRGRAKGQSSKVVYSLGRGEIYTPYPTENLFVIRCFRVWSQCIGIWIEFCQSVLSILKIPMKLLHYGVCFSEKQYHPNHVLDLRLLLGPYSIHQPFSGFIHLSPPLLLSHKQTVAPVSLPALTAALYLLSSYSSLRFYMELLEVVYASCIGFWPLKSAASARLTSLLQRSPLTPSSLSL